MNPAILLSLIMVMPIFADRNKSEFKEKNLSETLRVASDQFDGERVGKIKIGEPLASVTAAYGETLVKNTTLNKEGYSTPAVSVYDNQENKKHNRPLFTAIGFKGKISNIEIFDKKFKSISGVSVGDSLKEVRSNYNVRLLTGEGNVVAAPLNEGFSFNLDRETMPVILYPRKLEEQVPEAAKVSSIFLFGKSKHVSIEHMKQYVPKEVSSVIDRIMACNHWAGEEPYDQDRKLQILAAIKKNDCDKLEKNKSSLLKKYHAQRTLIEKSFKLATESLR